MSNISIRSLSTRYASARLYAEAFQSDFYCCRGGSRILETGGGGVKAGETSRDAGRHAPGKLLNS